ncbi:peptidoglycan glycosyltransferase FtsI [Arsenophonus sp.]|uniref:peptidoglycan glycosyltransferase FtsI n=1 Tax=Arsenophonus sp. TaxID=1872640 RepID=UPI0028592AA8|nr:peptidoglycan glycosyltransferase FtsI [Arsenophonus sp.]MDR5615678.1 peptidoglycan glycosyltransferase FtsI [Arsenophonus sp.]
MKPAHSIKYKRRYKETVSYISWRFFLLCAGIGSALIGLIIRVTYLQIIYSKDLVREGDMRSLRVKKVTTTRGMISDREGSQLAVSVPVCAIWADPKIVYENYENQSLINDPRWKELSNKLNIPLEQINHKIRINFNSRFVYLARQVNLSVGEYISKLKIAGIYLSKEYKRYYPFGPATAHLLGVTDIDGQGIEGIEKSFNYLLTGAPGKRIVRKDRYGRVIEDVASIDSQVAEDLILSIDERIQSLVYRDLTHSVKKHKAESGTAILVDIHTGEILAMANSPSYNPNNLAGTPTNIMRNRAITDAFEPGSTVKPMVIVSALNNGIIKENSVLNTQPYIINGHKIKDIAQYSELSITGILQKSSNVGISRLALAIPAKKLVDAYASFGLGKPTNVGLIGESSGIFPKKKIRWSEFERATFSFGYGLMVTPLQLARVYATIGSFGILRPLSIIKVYRPIPGTRVFPEKIMRKVVHMMESVALPGGGGVRAAIKGYRIAIKTGTVKKVGNDGHYVNQYIAYTAGIAPASNPRYALVVIINHPTAGKYYGGAVSAPVFGTIMSSVLRLMNIEPDALTADDKVLIIN